MIALAVGLMGVAVLRLRRTDRYVVMIGSVVLLALATPPIRTKFESSLPWHMASHVLVMFVVPLFLGWVVARQSEAPARYPWLPAMILNLVMVVSHLPRVFNFVMTHGFWAAELMNLIFCVSGLWFFVCIWRTSTPLRWSIFSVVGTMAVMLFLAMAMSIFSATPWYSSMASMPGMSMASDFSSQQLAAAILWICGDIWAVPTLVVLIRRLVEREGSLLNVVQRYSEPPSLR